MQRLPYALWALHSRTSAAFTVGSTNAINTRELTMPPPVHAIDWNSLIPAEQWDVYRCFLDLASREQLRFALGGGLAVGVYTGAPRNTKDLDIYIKPEDRERVIALMNESGLADYFDQKPYDRRWIYRGVRGDTIVDAIWAMANRRTSVDDGWLSGGAEIPMFDRRLRILPPEELIWSKLYVLQKDRCDWPDVLNLIYATGSSLDWTRMLDRVAEDLPLIKGVMVVFSWIAAERAQTIPRKIWDLLELPPPKLVIDPEGRPARPDLLDTRPWFVEQMMRHAA
jgi:hypothetical protein